MIETAKVNAMLCVFDQIPELRKKNMRKIEKIMSQIVCVIVAIARSYPM